MVGVPGRSQACGTCRQRRIACTLERPQCFQCIKSNRWCSGYQRDRIFIVAQGTAKHPAVSLATRIKSSSSQTTNKDQCQVAIRCGSRKGGRLSSKSDSLQSRVPSQNLALSQSAVRQQLLGTFLSNTVPRSQASSTRSTPWIMMLPDLNPTKALDVSSLAVCTANLSRANDDPRLLRESLQLYTQGLRELQIALWDPSLMYRDETLAACMMLAAYEAYECPSDSMEAYVTHQDGCARLVRLRGPEAHRSGLGHQIFLSFRTEGILQALAVHRPTYLADAEWISIPWDNEPKSALHKVIDQLALAPKLWGQADQLKELQSGELFLAAMKLIEQCWKVDDNLQRFREEIEANCPGPLHWPELSVESNAADNEEQGKVFPVSFHFVDLTIAQTMLFYWSTVLMLWSGMNLLYLAISTTELDDDTIMRWSTETSSGMIHESELALLYGSSQFDPRLLPPLEHRSDFLSAAWNICQSVEFCLQDDLLMLGAGAIGAPLCIVIETLRGLPHCKRELLWAENAFEKVRQKGIRVLKHVR